MKLCQGWQWKVKQAFLQEHLKVATARAAASDHTGCGVAAPAGILLHQSGRQVIWDERKTIFSQSCCNQGQLKKTDQVDPRPPSQEYTGTIPLGSCSFSSLLAREQEWLHRYIRMVAGWFSTGTDRISPVGTWAKQRKVGGHGGQDDVSLGENPSTCLFLGRRNLPRQWRISLHSATAQARSKSCRCLLKQLQQGA